MAVLVVVVVPLTTSWCPLAECEHLELGDILHNWTYFHQTFGSLCLNIV